MHDSERRSFSYIKTYWPLIVTMFLAAGAWFQMKSNLQTVQDDLREKSLKYIPIIEQTEHRVTIVEENNKQVLDTLRRIEHKIDR